MSGWAKTEEVCGNYFEWFKNSTHKLTGWAEIRANARSMSNEMNEKNYSRFFHMLSEDQKCAVFEICKNFKFYLIPLDGLLRSEEFKRSHQIRIKWIDDEGKSEMPKMAFATLVKG